MSAALLKDLHTDSIGYPCIQQVGRGKGNLLPQSYWPVTAAWPDETLEPVYEWNNTVTFAPTWGGVMFSADLNINQNRDYYLYIPSFTGASGVGSGLLSARPSTCTPLVAYWATDTNTLYQCATKNTWTAYYMFNIDPHPLTLGQSSGNPPAAPVNLTAVVQ